MVRLALGYAAVFAAIVLAADVGWLPCFVERLHHLPYCDKVVHFTLFGLLALAANLALAGDGNRSFARAFALGTILVLAIATAEEYSNVFVPRRDWSLGDLAANYLGVACIGLLPLWRRQLCMQAICDENDSVAPHDSPMC